MCRRILMVIFMAILLSGCASASKRQDAPIRRLQKRISYLERELKKKTQETIILEMELETIQEILSDLRKQK